MNSPSLSIRSRLTRMLLLSSCAVLAITSSAFCGYEFLTFRESSVQQLEILSQAIASNSTAALAFDNAEDAAGVLGAFSADPHIVAAALYDAKGKLFATYPKELDPARVPAKAGQSGYHFTRSALIRFQPVTAGADRLGMLYVESDLDAMYARITRYALIVTLVIGLSLALAYLISRRLQHQLLAPILALGNTARAVSERSDYSVRASRSGTTEIDLFTDTFNQMLTQIQGSESKLRDQLSRLSLLQHITRATGERQDLPSIFQVVLGSLEANLPIDFGCFLLYDTDERSLTVSGQRAGSVFAEALALSDGSMVPIDQNGLSSCIAGNLVYEPDVRAIQFPFPQRLAGAGLRSLVIAPLIVENQVFGVLVSARRKEQAFSSGECEFLKQLSEHVALASHQARLYGALQKAYDDLRLSQHTVMQQERLRALGQMASGIAHDINNAISPISLYTESLLEREPQLSERGRGYLVTIQQAIDDVARTVARMREFYREREAQLTLERVELNRAVRQVVELTRPRWSDLPQQRGSMIDLKMELSEPLAEIMGAENEIRDALTNLVFNAVDAMPSGGMITVRTRELKSAQGHSRSLIEVRDTGVGMDEDTRRRCLEPFYTTKGERGTGLGLAMVYGMVQRHSAELEIDSAPGQGTTVRLSFPSHTSSIIAPSRATRPTSIDRQLRILLVDDDPVLIKSLQDTLQEDGHLVSTAHGGQAGIDAFLAAHRAEGGFDVVITDLGMPHVDGRKVANAVKQVSGATPIILLTGWGQRMIDEKEMPEHVDRVLSKPPRLTALRAALVELLP
jgi:signal transduction histidine kinase/ActR/RegA family two-component response regulator